MSVILFLYPGRLRKSSLIHGKWWQARLRRVDWNSSAKSLIAVGMMLNKITEFGKKNCVYTISWWRTGDVLLWKCLLVVDWFHIEKFSVHSPWFRVISTGVSWFRCDCDCLDIKFCDNFTELTVVDRWIFVAACVFPLSRFFVSLLRCGILIIVRCHVPFLFNQMLPTRIRVLWRYWTNRFCCCPLGCCLA